MTETRKTSWKYTAPVIIPGTIEIGDLTFNSQPRGPGNFHTLRTSNYGEGFRQGTLGEISRLYSTARLKLGAEQADEIIDLRRSISGNTALLWTREGLIVQDNPEIKNGKIYMTPIDLMGRLGSRESEGVTYSDNGAIRFTPYGFKIGRQFTFDLEKNSGVIAILGEEEAQLFAEASGKIRDQPIFRGFDSLQDNLVRVPVLGEDGGHLRLVGNLWSEFVDYMISFGVREKVV